MAKLKLHIERVPLALVKKKIARDAANLSKRNGSGQNGHKAGNDSDRSIKNSRTR